jgi:hypothetical protein
MARFRISSNQEPQAETPALLFRDLRKQPSIKFLWGHQEKLLDQYHKQHLDTSDLANRASASFLVFARML